MSETSSALALSEPVEVMRPDYASMSLDELTTLVNEGHGAVERGVRIAFARAVQIGEVCLFIRERYGASRFRSWVRDSCDFVDFTAYNYMRVAHYRDQVPSSVTGIYDAIEALRGLPAVTSRREWAKPEWMHDEAKRLHVEGLTYSQIGEKLGVSRSVTQTWIHPDKAREAKRASAERQRRKAQELKAARKALAEKERREERNVLARAAGGILEKSYTDVRALCLTLDAALAQAEPAEREGLREALRHAHKAEDQIVEAMRIRRRA